MATPYITIIHYQNQNTVIALTPYWDFPCLTFLLFLMSLSYKSNLLIDKLMYKQEMAHPYKWIVLHHKKG